MSEKEEEIMGKEEVFKEFDENFKKRTEASRPDDDFIESQFLTADNEDKAKGFEARKKSRYLQQLAAEFFDNIEVDMDVSFNPRVKVPSGHLKVAWRDIEGRNRTDDVSEISMNGIKFRCSNFVPSTVKQLIYTRDGKTVSITRSEYISQEKGYAIFRLVEFENEGEDWMTWIEHLSRINEE